MSQTQHHRAFSITVAWTIGLIFLGSVVHATESSLACPDWPTCFGSWLPEMTGGVFWEHLHRLVAGGLIIFFLGATYLTWKEKARYPWILKASILGIGLLLFQAVLGGLTVLWGLPTAISSSHLTLALVFLGLATVLAVASSPRWHLGVAPRGSSRLPLRRLGVLALSLTLLQSVVGGAVRHTGSGMACPDVPLCLGQWIPAFQHWMVGLHFGHRVLGLVVLAVVLWLGHVAFWKGGSSPVRVLGAAAALTATAQVLLGFLSVYYRLAVVPVSLHTLLAAVLITVLTALAVLTWAPEPSRDLAAGDTPGAGRRDPSEIPLGIPG
jgi:heme A synthase